MEGKTGLDWGLVAEFFEEPGVVVLMDEGSECGEISTPPLVSGLPRRAKLGAKRWKRALDWEVVGEGLEAVVVAQFDAAGGVRDAAEGVGDGSGGCGLRPRPAASGAIPAGPLWT